MTKKIYTSKSIQISCQLLFNQMIKNMADNEPNKYKIVIKHRCCQIVLHLRKCYEKHERQLYNFDMLNFKIVIFLLTSHIFRYFNTNKYKKDPQKQNEHIIYEKLMVGMKRS